MNDYRAIDPATMFEMLGAWITQGPCTVRTKETPHTLLIGLCVPQDHVGRLVGKHGETIEALRRLALVCSSTQRRLVIEVVE